MIFKYFNMKLVRTQLNTRLHGANDKKDKILVSSVGHVSI